MGCLLTIILWPFYLIRWAYRNGWKGWVVFAVVVIAVLIGFFVIRGEINKAMNPEQTQVADQVVLPGETIAPYVIQTWSRIYYAAEAVKDKDGNVTMTDYWELNGGEWKRIETTLILDAASYGDVIVSRR